MKHTYLMTVALLCHVVDSVTAVEKTKLYFSFITALSQEMSGVTIGSIPMIDYAMEEINNSSHILPNYTLHYKKILDSTVNCDLV